MNSDSYSLKQKSKNLTKANDLRRFVRFVYDTFYELGARKAWLLWNIPAFREEVYQVAGRVKGQPVESIFRSWLNVYNLARFEPYSDNPTIKAFLEHYKLSCLRYKPLEHMVHDVIKLLEEADQAGWGLTIENFQRDRVWYELREDWAMLPEHMKSRAAYYLAGVRKLPLSQENERKVLGILAQKKLRYRQIAQFTSVYLPTEVDRMVLNWLKQQHNKKRKQKGQCTSCLLDQVDPSEKLRNDATKDEPAEIRDNLLLYKLGLFRIVRATQSDEIYIPQLQCFPCSTETPKRLVKGERYYVRYSRRIHGPEQGDPFELEAEAKENAKKIACREAFLEERDTYMEASGLSDLDSAIHAAVIRMEKMIAHVMRRYW
ncbi:hypothetical protein HUU05_23200 [candidate division KSB1 bacterium]|nr:hypothetical protein [candidate division KSB1 bacterium]